nr:hypothetical protein [Endozoicomonas ascidiicola]
MALNTGFKNYEVSELDVAGLTAGASAIITRNVKDFTDSELPVYTPEEYLVNVVSK